MQKLIKGMAIFAGVWSVFPWALVAVICLFCALMPDPGSIISFKVPWWAVAVVWSAEPLLWLLLWKSQESKRVTLLLTTCVGVCIGYGLWKDIVEVMLIWLGPTLLLLPLLFWGHRPAQTP
jgi:hypothetical protein